MGCESVETSQKIASLNYVASENTLIYYNYDMTESNKSLLKNNIKLIFILKWAKNSALVSVATKNQERYDSLKFKIS